MNDFLKYSWDRAWQGLGARGDGAAVLATIHGRYDEPHRKYHTAQHLEECLRLFDTVRDAADRPAEVEMALWFHDAIYDVKAADNERRSAAWARDALSQADVAPDAVRRVHDLVVITEHKASPQSRDEMVLVDVDLSILAAPAERFAEYERQIREEYAFVPGLVFRLKRRAILASFLARAAIYNTPALHRDLEARARANLAAAL